MSFLRENWGEGPGCHVPCPTGHPENTSFRHLVNDIIELTAAALQQRGYLEILMDLCKPRPETTCHHHLKKFQNVLKCLAFFSCLFLPLLNCLTELPLGSYPECPHSCRLSTDLFREAASCHVGDWGIIFYFFIFCTAEQTQRACRPVLPIGPMLLTFEPFRVQLHSPASLTSVEKTDRKESMPVPGDVAKKRNPGGAAKL